MYSNDNKSWVQSLRFLALRSAGTLQRTQQKWHSQCAELLTHELRGRRRWMCMKPLWRSSRQACVQPRRELFLLMSCSLFAAGDKERTLGPSFTSEDREGENVVFPLERVRRVEWRLGITLISR